MLFRSLKECPVYKHLDAWVYLNENISAAHSSVYNINKSIDNLDVAIKCRKSVLQEVTIKNNLDKWLTNTSALASLLFNMGEDCSNIDILNKSIGYFYSVLDVIYKEDDAVVGLWSKNNISTSLYDLARANFVLYEVSSEPSLTYLNSAVNYFERSINLGSIEEYPFDFGRTHNQLGNVYYCRGELNRSVEDFKLAIHSYQQSQLVFTVNEYPDDFSNLNEKIDKANLELVRS